MATTEPEHVRRIRELEAALRREIDRSTALEKRAAALEASARHAFTIAAFGAPRRDRQDAPNPRSVNN
jgi:hypothetical protein